MLQLEAASADLRSKLAPAPWEDQWTEFEGLMTTQLAGVAHVPVSWRGMRASLFRNSFNCARVVADGASDFEGAQRALVPVSVSVNTATARNFEVLLSLE